MLTDTLLTPAPDSAGRIKPRITFAFNLDFRTSFLLRRRVNIWGINSGIVFGKKRHQLTLGYYWVSYNTYLRLINWRKDAARRINLDYYTESDMWFVSTLYWCNVINNDRWMLTIPIELGGGVATTMPHDLRTDVQLDRTKRAFFVPAQIGLYTQWKATRWVGLSAQIGYRYSVFQTSINQHYNGTYYSFGATIYPTFWIDAWRFITKKEPLKPLHPRRVK
ncbi:hypothetical protein [Tellurirhabdus bombi]|uniref:hypothetical protein n=1 Tax=Tellurirhabdus bombi TaxID=2907205 RepID=UPI001F283B18|nr:hypothetical protein [Tellurirhabdus bombi]